MSMILDLFRVSVAELEAYKNDSTLLEKRIYESIDDPATINIDKSWNGILFLLTGQGLEENTHHLAKVFFSGQYVDEGMDLGYGPPEYLLPSEVKELSAELSGLTAETLAQKFDATRMTELNIYPDVWEQEDALDYLLDYFNEVKTFYSLAAEKNEVVIVALI